MKKILILILCVMFIIVLVVAYNPQIFGANEIDATALKWQSIAFGQSTDLNFSSTITPEKVGVNRVIPEVPGTINGKITLESRGGKLSGAHDGMTFYYTVIDTRKYNFILEADILIEQFGPETPVAPNIQTSCGLMVRDVLGAPRKEPMVFGYEELPAASNIAATAVFSGRKTDVNVSAVSRNGVYQRWGNPDIVLTRNNFEEGVPVGKIFKLKLQRTDIGFVMTYANADGSNEKSKEMTGIADIIQVLEKDQMYLGFFAARNAKMIVSNAKLTLSPANTKPGTPYQPAPFPQYFEIESSDGSSSDNYTLMARSGYNGLVSVVKDGVSLVSKANIKAGDCYQLVTNLLNPATKFEITFTPTEGPATGPLTRSITVQKRKMGSTNGLVVTANGKPTAAGTVEDPLDLATAVKYLHPGGTILLRGGNYGDFTISRRYSSLTGRLKKIMPYQNEKVVFKGFFCLTNYWHLYGLESTGSNQCGFRVQGNGNVIERCTAHDNQNTGFFMDSVSRVPVLKTSNNLYLNCESYDNTDPTMENADGYAVNTGLQNIGKGNVYRGCIAHHNADDGWDLFNHIQFGPSEPITLENCIAYQNGILTTGKTAGGNIGNGFKLGGEGQPVGHIVRNCIAFNNHMDGFTCNFNPGAFVVENCTSFDNARCNYIFRSNPYIKPGGSFRNNISFRTDNGVTIHDFIAGTVFEKNLFYYGKNDTVTASDFVSLKAPAFYKWDKKANIIWGDFLRLAKTSSLNKAGKNGTHLGALPAVK